MACLLYVIAVFVVLFGVASGQEEVAVGKYDNIEPFALLCRIYNVAKNHPINLVDLSEADKILEEIDALNRSLSEEERLNEEEDTGNNSETQVKPTVTRETALAQLSLNQITQRAHKILENIVKVNIRKEIEKAKTHFSEVVFGEVVNESDLSQSALSGVNGRDSACGKTGLSTKGDSAGKNLIVDFFCLCARRTDGAGVNQACGFYLGSNSENIQSGWDNNGPLGSSTMWASIKGGCGKHMQQHPKSTSEVHYIIDQFLNHLRTGGVYRWGDSNKIEGSNRKEGMFGTSVGTKDGDYEKGPVCNGKKGKPSPGGLCVYYGSGKWEENIDWLKQFKTALEAVDTVNKKTAAVQRDTEKLQMLLHRAEELYETAKVITVIQNPQGRAAAFQNVSGNLTAYNATRTRSYSHNTNTYFIPACVLLFL